MESRGANSNSRLVYSTDGGRVTPPPDLKRPHAPARHAPQSRPTPPDDGIVRVARDRKGRGGKTMTAITGLPGSETELDRLLKTLKASLGTGGLREGRTLLLQGDQRDRLIAELTGLGHKPKLAGG